MCDDLDIAMSSMQLWEREHTEFSAATAHARTLAQSWWERKGMDSLDKPVFQATLWIKSMVARFPDCYREKIQQEHIGKDGGPIEHSVGFSDSAASLLDQIRK